MKNSAYPPTNQIPGLCQSNDGQSASTFVKNEVAKARSETAAKLKSGRTKPNRHKVAPKKSPKVVIDYYTSDEDDKTYSKSSYSSSESDSCTSYSEDDLWAINTYAMNSRRNYVIVQPRTVDIT